jgi:outer membrane protein assembly factor BamA
VRYLRVVVAGRLSIVFRFDVGPRLLLDGFDVVGAERTTRALVARTLGLRPGELLVPYDPAEIVRKLEETALFAEVGEPQLQIVTDSSVVLRIPIRDEAPGIFDLVLGYLPGTQEGESGMLVGNGHLELRNLFGGGRVMSLRLNRLPGQVSSVDVRAGDPSLAGLPFGLEGRFEGLQQDSTYNKQRFAAEVNYRFDGGMQVFATVTRERTNPGFAGQSLSREGVQRIPRASALFGGLGVRFRRLDRVVNPRRGHLVEVNLERGRKERTAFMLTEQQDTTVTRSLLRQQRVQFRTRLYLPTASRQVLALGGEAALLLSNEYDESDLYRFGGATSLRGYDEDFFRGNFVGRGFAEYRYLLDRTSYTYLFFDLGYVDVADVLNFDTRGFFPGFGIGIQFQTNVGLINASYAVSPEDGLANGRIHVGLSFGL